MSHSPSRANRTLPSWSAAFGLLLLVTVPGCTVTDSQSCEDCHHDCGWGRTRCHKRCDAKPECKGDGGYLACVSPSTGATS
jgi:hypothetical protein